ncbi:MAG: phosphoglucomutase/phosphomannomutase family protein [Caldilineaceae bacterium]
MSIHFGTDGWRAVISDEFTFDNVRRVAQAIADWTNEQAGSTPPSMVVGYDTRFLSDRYAQEVAQVLSDNGVRVSLTNGDVPTPALSFAIRHTGASGGVMITASHNPPRYNGIKVKTAAGSSASKADCARIEHYLHQGDSLPPPNPVAAERRGTPGTLDIIPDYHAHLETLLQRDLIAKRPCRIVVDSMYGAGRGHIKRWLEGTGWQVTEIHGEMNPGFGGIHPEPIMPHLEGLRAAVVNGGYVLGLATDGDADRTGAIDERGRFIDPHCIFTLVLHHLLTVRGWRGTVVRSISMTQMIDRLCERYGLPVIETPVGFEPIGDAMLRGDFLMGGEESGGITIKNHVPVGDGILMGLLLLEIVSHTGATLAELVDSVKADLGPAHYARQDLRLTRTVNKRAMTDQLSTSAPRSIAGIGVARTQHNDGMKYLLTNGGWLLIRPSGTEPVLRVYAEAPEQEILAALLAYGQSIAATI